MGPLDELLDHPRLAAAAGDAAFARGEDYVQQGRVLTFKMDDARTTLTGEVEGGSRYAVRVDAVSGTLNATCTCPMGVAGIFCKHAVALALAWLGSDLTVRRIEHAQRAKRARRIEQAPERDIGTYLERLPRAELVSLVLEAAEWDENLEQRLALRALASTPQGVDRKRLEREIDRAVRPGDGIDYREAPTYAARLSMVVDTLRALLREGTAAEVPELVEHFMMKLDNALGDVDDSDGIVGDVLGSLVRLHHDACLLARPEPAALAARLLDLQLRSDVGAIDDVPQAYADVLGETGLAAYRTGAAALWANVRALGPGEKEREGAAERRSGITRIMQDLARHSGQLEELIAVLSRDLSSEWSFLEIARAYGAAGKPEAALAWAERGAREIPHEDARQLREFLAEEYRRSERFDEAVALAWQGFDEWPALTSYERLVVCAAPSNRAAWRERALALLRTRAAAPRAAGRRSWERPVADHTLLVEILLKENKVDAALTEAKAGACRLDTWLRLAKRVERSKPEDALTIYRTQLDQVISPMSHGAYDEGAALVRKVGDLLRRLGRGAEFAAYVDDVRAKHRRKRNFMRLLEGVN